MCCYLTPFNAQLLAFKHGEEEDQLAVDAQQECVGIRRTSLAVIVLAEEVDSVLNGCIQDTRDVLSLVLLAPDGAGISCQGQEVVEADAMAEPPAFCQVDGL